MNNLKRKVQWVKVESQMQASEWILWDLDRQQRHPVAHRLGDLFGKAMATLIFLAMVAVLVILPWWILRG
jgi:hypothetical protein